MMMRSNSGLNVITIPNTLASEASAKASNLIQSTVSH